MPFTPGALAFLRRKSLQELLASLPPRALVPLALAIFFLFSILGVLTDMFSGADQPAAAVVANVIFSGVVSLIYAYGGLRRRPMALLVALIAHVAYVKFIGWLILSTAPLPVASIPQRLDHDGGWIMVAMVTSYSCFLWFINGAAARYLRVRAEMDLAHGIHQILVPAVDTKIGGFTFLGFSAASGEVGGDLVDVVSGGNDEWFGYVADVSGHGVSSGVVMGMFKSALRMGLRRDSSISALLEDLNAVLVPLTDSAMFVTVACVRERGGLLEYAVAGHVPILRVRAGLVEEITTPQIPVGMFEDYAFTSATLDCVPGDLLALITDGLIEVFDASDRELGLDAVKRLLAERHAQPLREIADAIVAMARGHGTQIDDQTLLLIRR